MEQELQRLQNTLEAEQAEIAALESALGHTPSATGSAGAVPAPDGAAVNGRRRANESAEGDGSGGPQTERRPAQRGPDMAEAAGKRRNLSADKVRARRAQLAGASQRRRMFTRPSPMPPVDGGARRSSGAAGSSRGGGRRVAFEDHDGDSVASGSIGDGRQAGPGADGIHGREMQEAVMLLRQQHMDMRNAEVRSEREAEHLQTIVAGLNRKVRERNQLLQSSSAITEKLHEGFGRIAQLLQLLHKRAGLGSGMSSSVAAAQKSIQEMERHFESLAAIRNISSEMMEKDSAAATRSAAGSGATGPAGRERQRRQRTPAAAANTSDEEDVLANHGQAETMLTEIAAKLLELVPEREQEARDTSYSLEGDGFLTWSAVVNKWRRLTDSECLVFLEQYCPNNGYASTVDDALMKVFGGISVTERLQQLTRMEGEGEPDEDELWRRRIQARAIGGVFHDAESRGKSSAAASSPSETHDSDRLEPQQQSAMGTGTMASESPKAAATRRVVPDSVRVARGLNGKVFTERDVEDFVTRFHVRASKAHDAPRETSLRNASKPQHGGVQEAVDNTPVARRNMGVQRRGSQDAGSSDDEDTLGQDDDSDIGSLLEHTIRARRGAARTSRRSSFNDVGWTKAATDTMVMALFIHFSDGSSPGSMLGLKGPINPHASGADLMNLRETASTDSGILTPLSLDQFLRAMHMTRIVDDRVTYTVLETIFQKSVRQRTDKKFFSKRLSLEAFKHALMAASSVKLSQHQTGGEGVFRQMMETFIAPFVHVASKNSGRVLDLQALISPLMIKMLRGQLSGFVKLFRRSRSYGATELHASALTSTNQATPMLRAQNRVVTQSQLVQLLSEVELVPSVLSTEDVDQLYEDSQFGLENSGDGLCMAEFIVFMIQLGVFVFGEGSEAQAQLEQSKEHLNVWCLRQLILTIDRAGSVFRLSSTELEEVGVGDGDTAPALQSQASLFESQGTAADAVVDMGAGTTSTGAGGEGGLEQKADDDASIAARSVGSGRGGSARTPSRATDIGFGRRLSGSSGTTRADRFALVRDAVMESESK